MCAADYTDATALTFVKTAIERRDDLLETVAERAWDWHDGESKKAVIGHHLLLSGWKYISRKWFSRNLRRATCYKGVKWLRRTEQISP